jgi:hypothetical protein
MPSEIVDLDKILPQDIEFVFDGEKFCLSGKNIRFEQALLLGRLMTELGAAEAKVQDIDKPATRKDWDEVERVTKEVEAILLELFQVRHPDLERLPFGAQAFSHVLARVLVAINYAAAVEDAAAANPPSNRATRRKKSPRSNSSRSS